MFDKPVYNFLYSLILVLITAAFCSYFNRIGMQNFYSDIKLSALTPPNIVFPFVWAVLYILLTMAFYFVLNNADKTLIRPAATLFTFNMFLQVLWTFVFFYNAYFFSGFMVLIILDFAGALLVWAFYQINRTSGLMLIPYFLWLLFATYLNWAVVLLNHS
ncbi:MAG: tryptophan-rich sensory protein [Alphaproteobacteria bacterium]|nr:tryptophan-rich sensory protein [Alphaproteobacteria bacterium]